MAIRVRNLDLEVEGGKRHVQVVLDPFITASTVAIEKPIFTAPIACRIDFIDFYTEVGASGNSTDTIAFRVQQGSASGTIVAARGPDNSAASDNLVAFTRYRLPGSANTSMSTGQMLILNVSANCAVTFPSAALVHVTYTPITHRESR